MVRNIKTALALVALTFTFALRVSVYAQDSMKHEDKTKIWLPPRDSNPDMLIQSQLSCR